MTRQGHLRFCASTTLAAVLLCAGVTGQQSQAPTFRSGVEVTTLDVSVVDDNSRPVVDLKPDEFTVRIDGVNRRVVRVEWIPLTVSAPGSTAAATPPPPAPPAPPAGYSTNQSTTRGRLILIAVDQPNLSFGAALSLRSALNGFIDRLEPADRVAAVPLGQGGVSTPFTTNREEVKKALASMNGDMVRASQLTTGMVFPIWMTSMEAVEIAAGDRATLSTVNTRECPPVRVPKSDAPSPCLDELQDQAREIARFTNLEAEQTMNALRSLLDGLKPIDAPKTLVVVSQGFSGRDQAAIVELGTMATAAHTSLYVLQVDGSADVVSDQVASGPAVSREKLARAEGIGLLASVARGEVFNVIGTGLPAIARLEREVSGYYLVGVESTLVDGDGKVHPITVHVTRPNLTVRARRELAPDAARRDAARTPKEVLTSAIRSPLLEAGLPMLVTTESFKDADPARIQLQIRAEVGRDYSSTTPITVAYVIEDAKGKAVVNQLGDGKLPPKESSAASPLMFTATASVVPGDYTLKLAIVEGAHVGSVEHVIHTGTIAAAKDAPAPAAAAGSVTARAAAPTILVPQIAVTTFRREDSLQVETLQRFRDTVPGDSRAAFDAGVAALGAGDFTRAEASLKNAVTAGLAGGNSSAALAYLGATYAATGRDADAIGIWQAALVDGSGFSEIYRWLADALVRIRNFDEARSLLREATAKWPSDAGLSERLAKLQLSTSGGR